MIEIYRPATVEDLSRYALAHHFGLYWAEHAERGDEASDWIADILDDQCEAWEFLAVEDADYAPAVRLYLLIHNLDRAANVLRDNKKTVESLRQQANQFWRDMFDEQPDNWMLGGFATGIHHFATGPVAA